MAHLCFPRIHHFCVSIFILIQRERTSIPNLLDITNRAKQHWNSISRTCQARIIRKCKERLQVLRAVDEFCVPAFVGPDGMGDLVDDVESMFD